MNSLGEGCTSIMGGTEVPPGTKIHEHGPSQEYAPHSSVAKRSYKRAINRIAKHGFTWYHGALLTHQHISASQIPIPRSSPTKIPCEPNVRRNTHGSKNQSFAKQRFSCMSWNVGKLTLADWDILQSWIRLQDIDLLLLQETGWKHTSQWTKDNFHCFHSGTTDSGGLLTLVAKKFCDFDKVSWCNSDPGRIQHLRLYLPGRTYDIVNCYQYVNRFGNQQVRSQFWDTLTNVLTNIPNRNMLLVAGDMNTNLTQTSTCVGLSTYCWNNARVLGTQARDEKSLQQILKQFNLIALNSWNHLDGPTFQNHVASSRIDFLFTRSIHADQQARDVRQLHQMPLVPETGPFHVPLLTTLRKCWHQQDSPPKTGWTPHDRKRLRHHWIGNDPYVGANQGRC